MTEEEYFDSIADRWDDIERPDISDRLRRVMDASALEPGMRVLDVGTGTGVLLPLLRAGIGPEGVIVAMDVSARMLDQARAKHPEARAEFLKVGLEHAGLPDASFDRVFCNAVFPHFPDERLALDALRRLTRPGGLLVISHPIGRAAVNAIHHGADGPIKHDVVPSPDAMRAMLEAAGFTEIVVTDEPEFHMVTARAPAA